MKIKVTAEHITNGVRKNSKECMAFLAMRDAGLPIEACAFTLWLDHAGQPHRLPSIVGDKIGLFDEGFTVKPFEFEIPWPESEPTVVIKDPEFCCPEEHT